MVFISFPNDQIPVGIRILFGDNPQDIVYTTRAVPCAVFQKAVNTNANRFDTACRENSFTPESSYRITKHCYKVFAAFSKAAEFGLVLLRSRRV